MALRTQLEPLSLQTEPSEGAVTALCSTCIHSTHINNNASYSKTDHNLSDAEYKVKALKELLPDLRNMHEYLQKFKYCVPELFE